MQEGTGPSSDLREKGPVPFGSVCPEPAPGRGPVLRSFGYVLIGVLVLALAAGVTLSLASDLSRWVLAREEVRLTALDVPAPSSPAPAYAMAVLETAGETSHGPWLRFYFEDEWTGRGWVNPLGLARCARPGGLQDGKYRCEVYMPEQLPLLGVRAAATVWVRPAETPVLWVDAAALLAPAPDIPVPQAARRALADPANTATPVYLVGGTAGAYDRARQRLAEADLPPGPAVWLVPGAASRYLGWIRSRWPNVRGAIVAEGEAAEVVGGLVRPVVRVPAAAEDGTETDAARRWRDAVAATVR